MNWGKKLAILSMIVSSGTCIGYALAGDFRRAIYWLAAAVITASVTL